MNYSLRSKTLQEIVQPVAGINGENYKRRSEQNGQFVCSKCDKTFSHRQSRNRHMRMHMGIFKCYCDQCKKGFSDVTSYNEHMRKHEGMKYYCDYCGKPFTTKVGFQGHLLTHTLDKK